MSKLNEYSLMINKKAKYRLMKIGVVLTTILMWTQSCSSAKYSSEDIKMEKINRSPQYNEGKFVNKNKTPGFKFGNMISAGWKFLTAGGDRTPDVDLSVKKVDFTQISNAKSDELKVTWVGHDSQIINIDGKVILTDPVYENKTVFMGPSRFNGNVPLNIDDLPEIDLVLISHNHYDHFNTYTLRKIAPKVKYFIVPLMVGAQLEDLDIPREKIYELDWWDEIELFGDLKIVFTPTQHFSGRGLFDRDETLWGSFVIEGPFHKIYFSGDSGYFEGFKQIGEKYGPFDYTFIECGAYDEKWKHIHMMPEQSVQAHIDLKGKIMQPMHWGTFNLALHAWYDPMIRVSKAADSLGVRLSTPIVGETITINKNLITERWWEKVLYHKKINELAINQ